MKPGDHPDFFRLPPPPGRSRESTIRLDADGRFWHNGEPVTHAGMARAFAGWIRRHPDDGRYILSNGYDWSYFEVEGTPLFVQRVRLEGDAAVLCLFDGSEAPLDPEALWIGEREALHTRVADRDLEARFQPAAQVDMAPILTTDGRGGPALTLGGRVISLQEQQKTR
jgi:hypothetical protein